MRSRSFVMMGALLLVSAAAHAQPASGAGQNGTPQDVPKTTVAPSIPDVGMTNQIDVGIRGTNYATGSDQARYQRYQDLRNGAFLDKFVWSKQTDQYQFDVRAYNVGYRDQQFVGAYNKFGKVKVAFNWNQIQLDYSYTTATLYTSPST